MSITANSPMSAPLAPTSDSLSIQAQVPTTNDTTHQLPRYSAIAGASSTTPVVISSVAVNSLSLSASPPRYSSVFQSRSRPRGDRTRSRRARIGTPSEQDRNAVPSSSSGLQLREFHITSGSKAKPWTNLKIYGRSSASSSYVSHGQKVLRFTGSDLVRGSLDLNLEAPQNINSINLSLRGRVITSSYEDGACTFLDLPIVSWNRNNGDPRSMFQLPGDTPASVAARTKKFDGKFMGKYSWPFSFHFPDTICLPGQPGQALIHSPSPPTFLERGTQGNVEYELVLRIAHGILRSDSKLHANIIYVPNIAPAPSSILRQLAYSQRLKLPGPEADPEGWCTLPSATLYGKIFGERSVKLECKVSIANPQMYTRGTVIPCHISIRCKDVQALDALACPDTLVVCLIRRVQYYQDGGQSFLSQKQKQALSVSVRGNASGVQGGMLVDVVEVEKAVWWANTDDGRMSSHADDGVNTKELTGEIHLDKELQPSCVFSLFKVSYAVELLPFESAVFRPRASKKTSIETKHESSQTIISHPIAIATLPGEGPIPIPVTNPKPRKERTVLRNTTDFVVLDMFRTY